MFEQSARPLVHCTMGDRSASRQSRYAALVVVAALHFVLVTLLSAGSRIRLLSPAAQNVTTTMVSLRRAPQPPAAGPAPTLHLAPLPPLAPLVPAPPAITYPSADITPQSIDWRSEAQKTAAAITNSKGVPLEAEDRRKTSSSRGPRPWFPPAAHHAGEEYKTTTGDKIIWVSDKCYVRSSAPMLGVPDIFVRGMLSATFCQGSGPARGDLFEALPAYKKYHPEPEAAPEPAPKSEAPTSGSPTPGSPTAASK